MTPEALEALKGSIEKWKAIVDGSGADIGSGNCALCQVFQEREDENGLNCYGCPVSDATGWTDCLDTPYLEWREATDFRPSPIRVKNDREKAAAQKELDFLISLLPPAEPR